MVTAPRDIALIVLRDGQRVLLQRRSKAPFAGMWELPGGRIEPGETPAQAAGREAREELGIAIGEPRLFMVQEHRYAQGPWVRLHAFEAEALGAIRESPELRWVDLGAIATLPVLEGTVPILAACGKTR